jgi:GNAT superfamily N-acetyltransferase
MPLQITETSTRALDEYAGISIAFVVQSRLALEPVGGGLGGVRFVEVPEDPPYTKNYDTHGNAPPAWSARFDTSRWAVLFAERDGHRVGGAVLAWATPGVHMLCGRRDFACLWDLRIRPSWRGRGVGTALLERAAEWARRRGCSRLRIETQNVNVPACRFYSARGCRLVSIDADAYAHDPALAHEVQLIWSLDL